MTSAPMFRGPRATSEFPVMQRAWIKFFRRMAGIGVNIFGGFAVTRRMLGMFAKGERAGS